ncbi:MAG: ComEA family DNA-binding protein [Pyrinomonadaceae bacterium]
MARHTPVDANRQATTEADARQNEIIARINVNTASPEVLEKLPGIGTGLAARIIEHREQFGRFRRAEHLIAVRGISERRFIMLRKYITVD